MDWISNIFGGKVWYKSLTAWGVLIWTIAQTAVPAAANVGIISADAAATLTDWMNAIAVPLGALGIRKAAITPDVAPK